MDPNKDFFSVQIGAPEIGSSDLAKLKFDPVIPDEANDGPFQIIPQYI